MSSVVGTHVQPLFGTMDGQTVYRFEPLVLVPLKPMVSCLLWYKFSEI